MKSKHRAIAALALVLLLSGLGGTALAATDGATGNSALSHSFVAVGYGGRRMISTDLGLTWINIQQDEEDGGDDIYLLRGVTFAMDRFVAVGGRILSTTDGLLWQSQPRQLFLGDVVYANNLFVAVGGCGQRVWSEDAVTWNATDYVAPPSGISGCGHLRHLAFGSNRFIAVGNEGRRMISLDGKNWSDDPPGPVMNDITFGQGRFVAAGNNHIYSSVNGGADWQITDVTGSHYRIGFGGGLFLATGSDFQTSSDGVNWISHPASFSDPKPNGPIGYGNGVYLSTGYRAGHYAVLRSTDGINWSEVMALPNNQIESFAYAPIPEPGSLLQLFAAGFAVLATAGLRRIRS